MERNENGPKSRGFVATMIAEAPLLHTLEVSFNTILDRSSAGDLSLLFEHRAYWPRLKTLQLQAIRTSESALRAFLIAHTLTLGSLELRDMFLHEVGSSRGPWVSIILFLESALNLEKVRLGGILSNGSNEGWYVHDPDEIEFWGTRGTHPNLPPPKGSCLKHRIEQFIVKGGEVPVPIPVGTVDLQLQFEKWSQLHGDESCDFFYPLL